MIVLNNFWNKDYIQKRRKNASQRCWVMNLNSSTKKEAKCCCICTLKKGWRGGSVVCAISIIQPNWITEARDEWKKDEEVWTLIQNLQQDPSTSNTFSWKNDSLWYKDCLYICKNSQLKQKILLELHTTPLGGHSRFLKTSHRVKKEFFWDGLKSDIQNFVAEWLFF